MFKMPHSTNKRKDSIKTPSLGMGKYSCGQTFEYSSERDLNMKLQMHSKFCSNPPVGCKKVGLPKKSMTLEEILHYGVERKRKVHK